MQAVAEQSDVDLDSESEWGDLEDDWESETDGESESGSIGRIGSFAHERWASRVVESEQMQAAFASDASGGSSWREITLNSSWTIRMPTSPEAAAEYVRLMQASADVDNTTIWPEMVFEGAIALARWLATAPPSVNMPGQVVIEIGAGLGLPGIIAACMGAERVLLQDRNGAALRGALVAAVDSEVASRVSTVSCSWRDLPELLRTHSDNAFRRFADFDIILGTNVIYDRTTALDVADLLGALLRKDQQVAYISAPRTQEHEAIFLARCRDLSLWHADLQREKGAMAIRYVQRSAEEDLQRVIAIRYAA